VKIEKYRSVMSKFNIFISVLAITAALFVYRYNIAVDDVQPETMANDVWWGPANTDMNEGDIVVRPFRINVSAEVSTYTEHYRPN